MSLGCGVGAGATEEEAAEEGRDTEGGGYFGSGGSVGVGLRGRPSQGTLKGAMSK
jgi:hypothetical protein